MPGINSGYSGAPGTGDTTRFPSVNLWNQVDAGLLKRGMWNEVWHDFIETPFTTLPTTEGEWGLLKFFSDTGGVFTAQDLEGGVRILGSDGDNEGSYIASSNQPFKIIQNHGELVFECRVKDSTIADTKHGFIAALMDSTALTATVPITAGGAIADVNIVGFHRLEGDGDMVDTVYKADSVTQVTVQADAITLVADTYVKLGMVFNRGGDNILRFYKDGLELTTSKFIPSAAGTDFPNDVRLGWVIGALNATATTPGNLYLDWVRIAQRNVTNAH